MISSSPDSCEGYSVLSRIFFGALHPRLLTYMRGYTAQNDQKRNIYRLRISMLSKRPPPNFTHISYGLLIVRSFLGMQSTTFKGLTVTPRQQRFYCHQCNTISSSFISTPKEVTKADLCASQPLQRTHL